MNTIAPHHLAAIRAAAEHVAAAVAAHDRAFEPLAQAQAQVDVIEKRQAEKVAQRAAIITRRQSGDPKPDDGADLTVIQADAEGLAAMLVDAEAAADVLRGPLQEAGRALGFAREGLRTAELAAETEAVVAYAGELDRRLLDTVGRLDALKGRKDGRPVWGASAELRKALQRLAIMRREV